VSIVRVVGHRQCTLECVWVCGASSQDILGRLKRLEGYKAANPNLKLYLSSVVMRIPSYNEGPGLVVCGHAIVEG
jgi:hypothetical protein